MDEIGYDYLAILIGLVVCVATFIFLVALGF